MNWDKKSLLLYGVTDRSWVGEKTLMQQVEEALDNGVTFLQLREKELSEEAFLEEAKEVKKMTQTRGVPLIINDNVEVAIACDAQGIHVGQSDMEAGEVRKRLGNEKILGVSVRNVEQALFAQRNGADYLGVGAMFATSTKADACDVSFDTLQAICKAVTIPVVAIGGITYENVDQLEGSGICGVAVVSAVFGAKEVGSATEKLRKKLEQLFW